MWEELRWKVFCMYKWRGTYSQGWNWPLWLFDYPHDCLTSMTFRLYISLYTTTRSLGLPCDITLIDNIAHSRGVGNMTHDMARHDSDGTFMMLWECMSSYSIVGWWMSSWCFTASPPHGKVRGVFDGFWFAWWSFGMLFLAFILEGLTGSSIRERCMFLHSSVHEHILHVCSFVHR